MLRNSLVIIIFSLFQGIYEALELRDKDKSRYHGKSVQQAIDNINKELGPAVIGKNPADQRDIDDLMLKLDGTDNKNKMGANAILGISMAVCKVNYSSTVMCLTFHFVLFIGRRR